MAFTCPDGHNSTAGDYCDVCGSPIAASAAPSPGTSSPAASSSGSALDLDAAAAPPSAAPAAAARSCPNCAASNLPDALFCEDCGYDFTTGQLPRPLDPPVGAPAAVTPAAVTPAAVTPAAVTPAAVTPGSGLPSPAAATGSSDAGAVVQAPPTDPAPPVVPPTAQKDDQVEWVVEVWVDPEWYAAQDIDDPCPSAGMPVVVPLHARSVLVGRTSVTRNIHPDVDIAGDNGVSRRHCQLTTDGLRWWVEDLASSNGTYVGSAGAEMPGDPITAKTELPDDGRVYLGAWTRLVVRKAAAGDS